MTASILRAALVAVLAASATAAGSESFETQLLALGHARLNAPKMGTSNGFLKELGALTGLEEAEVRSRLLALTDSLEARRKRESPAWKALLALRPQEVAEREASGFLKHLLKESRKLLEEEKSKPLNAVINKASRRARLAYDGQALLTRIVGEPSRRSAPGPAAGAKVGILVDARPFLLHEDSPREDWLEALRADLLERPGNNYFTFFRVGTPQAVLDKSDELFAAVEGALVEALPRSAKVKWAVAAAGKRLLPDYRLLVRYTYGLSNPTETGTPGEPGAEWMISFQVTEVRLIDVETDSEVFHEGVYGISLPIRPGEEGNLEQAAADLAERLAREVDDFIPGG